MNTIPSPVLLSRSRPFLAKGRRLCASVVAVVSVGLFSSTVQAQPVAEEANQGRRGRGGQAGERQQGPGGGRGNFSPEDMQARLTANLRERFEVTDDEEWKVISDRITKVMELRRAGPAGGGGAAAFGFAGRGGDAGGRGAGRGGRGGGNNQELAALQDAVRDKLPDAEIKSRLERVRELRKSEEMKLAQAQEELRAVLTVRQEAAAVLAGLLP